MIISHFIDFVFHGELHNQTGIYAGQVMQRYVSVPENKLTVC